jgi:hypothetical protein
MTVAEQRRAEELKFYLDEREREITDAKQERNKVLSLAAEAAEQGADNLTLNKITQAKNLEEALSVAGSTLGNKFRIAQEQRKFENDLKTKEFALDSQYKRAQIANIQSQIADRNASGNGMGNVDPANILAFAQQYASTGQIPTGIPKNSFGLISQVAKELPKPEGTLVDMNTGIKPSKLSSTQVDGIAALYDIQKKVADLKALDTQRTKGVTSATFGKVFGSNAQDKYLSTKQEIIDLLARARTGAALTAAEEKFYADQLPGRIGEAGPFNIFGADTQKRIGNFENKINQTLESKLEVSGASIYGFSKVKLPDGKEHVVGETLSLDNGLRGRVNPDGSITITN